MSSKLRQPPRTLVTLLLLALGSAAGTPQAPPALPTTATPQPPSLEQYCVTPQNASSNVCEALSNGLCTKELTTEGCHQALQAPIQQFCGNPSAANTAVCLAYKKSECPDGLSILLCDKKLSQGFFGGLFEQIAKNAQLRDAAGLLIIGVLTLLVGMASQKIRVLDARLGDPMRLRPRTSGYRTRGVNVILVGLGGAGKTSIVRALSGCGEANPAAATVPRLKVKLYSVVQEIDVIDGESSLLHDLNRIYIEDYEGQQFGNRLHDGTVRKREELIPSTVIVLVVDLFYPSKPSNQKLPSRDSWEESRVRENLKQYPEGVLNSIKLMTPKCSRVCLFINKADLVQPYDDHVEAAIMKRFQPLREDIDNEFQGCETTTIIGSAASGWGVSGVDPTSKRAVTLLEFISGALCLIDFGKAK